MKRIKIAFALAAVFAGVGSAIATTGKTTASAAARMNHNWIDWNNDLVLMNVPKSFADQYCVPSIEVCLRAQDNVYIYTTGYLPWAK
jgi:hypothetical protein